MLWSKPNAPAAVIAFAGFIALAVAMGIGRFAFTPLLPMMQEDAGVSVVSGGWLAAANYCGYLLGALSALWMRIGAVTAIRAGLLAIGLATLAMGLVNHFTAWLGLRALSGMMSAWVLVFVSAQCLERLAPPRRPTLNGLVFAGVGAGIFAAGALSIVLMRAHASSAQAWIILGAVALVLVAAVWSSFDADTGGFPRGERPSPEERRRWDGDAVRLILCYGAFGFSYIIPATFLPVMAKQALPDPAVFGWCWPIFGAAALVSTLVASRLQESIGNRRLWAVSHLLMALGIALPVFWHGITGTLLAGLFVGGTFMVITMAALREARAVAGAHAAPLIAAMTAAFATGQIAGPLSVSYLFDEGADFTMPLLIACMLLAMTACALSGPRTDARAYRHTDVDDRRYP